MAEELDLEALRSGGEERYLPHGPVVDVLKAVKMGDIGILTAEDRLHEILNRPSTETDAPGEKEIPWDEPLDGGKKAMESGRATIADPDEGSGEGEEPVAWSEECEDCGWWYGVKRSPEVHMTECPDCDGNMVTRALVYARPPTTEEGPSDLGVALYALSMAAEDYDFDPEVVMHNALAELSRLRSRPEPTLEGEDARDVYDHALSEILVEIHDRVERGEADLECLPYLREAAARISRLRESPEGERERVAGRIVLGLVNELPITADDDDFGCELLDRLSEIGVTRPAAHDKPTEGEG